LSVIDHNIAGRGRLRSVNREDAIRLYSMEREYVKLLLINPPYTKGTKWIPVSPPLGIGQISSFLKQHGYEVKLIDAFDWDDRQIADTILTFKPEIIGVTGNSMIRYEQYHICELAKEVYPHATVVAGGTHVTAMTDQALRYYPAIDVVVRNEGEETMLELAEGKALDKIDGISYVQDGEVIHKPARKPIEDLDCLPFIDWDSFDLKRYHRETDCDPLLNVGLKSCLLTSRGCVHRCKWCYVKEMFGRRWRTMGVRRIMDEVRFLVERKGVSYVRFYDDEFCTSRKRTVELCERIVSEKLKFNWRMQTRVDSLDPELCSLMKRAGCVTVELGIESGCQRILDATLKDTTVEQNRNAIRMVKEARLLAKAFMIIGNVDETVESLEETDKFLRETRPDWCSVCTGVRVLPKTQVWNELKEKRLVRDEIWLECKEVPFYPVDVPNDTLRQYTELWEGNRYRDRDPRTIVP